jgi:hypothetical protein
VSTAGILRATAIAMAAAGIFDPRVPFPRRERPSIRVVASDASADATRLRARLDGAGFSAPSAGHEAATVLAGNAPFGAWQSAGRPVYAIAPAAAPDVAITHAAIGASRLPGQAAAASVTLHGRGGRGVTSEVALEDAGVPVASARHQWTADDEEWHLTLSYLPDSAAAVRLRLHVAPLPGETSLLDNNADVLVPPQRGPLRTLVVGSGGTWPAAFLRRALEGDPAFDVATLERTSRVLSTRGGGPPGALTPEALRGFEAVIVGAPDDLPASTLETLRGFMHERGGIVAFVPDKDSSGAWRDLAGVAAFAPRMLAAPATLTGSAGVLAATELLVPQTVPPLAEALAVDGSGRPVVFVARRGAGAAIVSGALDAWRYRERNGGGFARFWRSVLAAQAAAVPPRLEATVDRAVVRPGERVRLTARLRSTELPQGAGPIDVPAAAAYAVGLRLRPGSGDPAASEAEAHAHPSSSDDHGAGRVQAHMSGRAGVDASDAPLRLWPGPRPGVYWAEWRAAAAGTYALDVRVGDATAAAIVEVAADTAPEPVNRDAVAIVSRASGGRVVRDEEELMDVLRSTFPAVTVTRAAYVTRSPWWAASFALLLGGEWALRRRRGLP